MMITFYSVLGIAAFAGEVNEVQAQAASSLQDSARVIASGLVRARRDKAPLPQVIYFCRGQLKPKPEPNPAPSYVWIDSSVTSSTGRFRCEWSGASMPGDSVTVIVVSVRPDRPLAPVDWPVCRWRGEPCLNEIVEIKTIGQVSEGREPILQFGTGNTSLDGRADVVIGLTAVNYGTEFFLAGTLGIEWWSPYLNGRMPGRVALFYTVRPNQGLASGSSGGVLFHRFQLEVLPTFARQVTSQGALAVGLQVAPGAVWLEGKSAAVLDVFGLAEYRTGRANGFLRVGYGWASGDATQTGYPARAIGFAFGLTYVLKPLAH